MCMRARAAVQLACRTEWVSGVDAFFDLAGQGLIGHVCVENKGDSIETAGLLSSINSLPGSVPTVIFL